MPNTFAPELIAMPPTQQLLNSIYYWINQNTWAPGIAFPSGPQLPTIDQTPGSDDPQERDFFFLTSTQHLHQLQKINETLTWVDLGTAANAITSCGTTLPGSANEGDLFNKYDEGNIYQWLSIVNDQGELVNPDWRNIGSNKGGLPLGADAITFTDSSKSWRSARLGMLLTVEGASPLLATDVGFIVKKDFTAGGFIGTNQGEVWIGHGRANANDNPKILMMHSDQGYDKLYLTKANGSTPAHLDLDNMIIHGALCFDDTNYLLYRNEDGAIHLQTPSSPATGLNIEQYLNVGKDVAVTGNLTAQGYLKAGAGTGGYLYLDNSDTYMYRAGASTIQTNSHFYASGIVQGTSIWANSSQPFFDLYYGGVCEWKIGMLASSSSVLYFAPWGGASTAMTLNAYGYLATALDVQSGGDVWVGTSSGVDSRLHRSDARVIQVLDENGSLATIEASNAKIDHLIPASSGDIYTYGHIRGAQGYNLMPYANNNGNVGGNGSGSNYYWGAVYANYLKYHTEHSAFDHINDLDAVKYYRTKTGEAGNTVIDDESLPFLRDSEGFFRPDRVNGFLLGCAKATALKHDEQDEKASALLSRIEALENQLRAIQEQA